MASWSGFITAPSADAMAPAIFQLVASPSNWINRRVESIEFTERDVIRRRLSIDVTVPGLTSLRPYGPEREVLLPLLFVRKQPLRHFDLRDDDGRSLSLITLRENSQIAAGVLRFLARFELRRAARRRGGEPPKILDAEVERLCLAIASAAPAQAERLFRYVDSKAKSEPTSQLATVAAGALFRDWASRLGTSFLMCVGVSAPPSAHKVIKLGYDEGIRRWGMTMAMRLGYESAEIQIATNAVGVPSYHAEILAPEELIIDRAAIVRRSSRGSSRLAEDRLTSRAHLYVTGQPSRSVYTLAVELRLRTDGLLLNATVIGIGTTILLIAGAAYGRHFRQEVHPDPVIALLVALPAGYAAYVAARAANLVTEAFLAAIRQLILVYAGLTLLAALALVVHLGAIPTHVVWAILGVLAIGPTAVVTAALGRWHWREWSALRSATRGI